MKNWNADVSCRNGFYIVDVYDENGIHMIQTTAKETRQTAVESAIQQAHEMGAYIKSFGGLR